MSNIVIDIAAQFTGQKAFNKSEQAIDKLGKTLKNALIGAGITKVLTDSIKAFAEDEKAAANLANTLQNLGLATFTASVESMIDKTQLATGVLDDQLRPAFVKLVTSTGDAIKAQELLKIALDVSAGSGTDLVSVSADIAAIMAGNKKSLRGYSLGLTQTQIAALSANDAIKLLAGTFSGASERASKTFSGSMLRIKAAVDIAKESLGKGLVDGLMIATGSQNIDVLQQKILDFGISAGATFKQIGTVIKDNLSLLKNLAITFAAIWTAGKIIAGVEAVRKIIMALTATYRILAATALGAAIAEMAVLNPLLAVAYGATLVAGIAVAIKSLDLLTDKFSTASTAAAGLTGPKQFGGRYADLYLQQKAALQKKITADQLAKDKAAAAAATNNKTKADKLAATKDLALKKASAVFDITRIQIAAALKATYDKDERLRLLAMQAIENDNGEAALEYIKQLNLLTAEQQTNKLAGIKSISETELNYINQLLLDELQRIKTTKMTEEEAALARQAAYAKYNAAIQQSGGLAEANFYSEKTQVELLSIAKLASLDKVASAQATMDILNYTTQTDIISRIAAAQKIADDAKYKALQDYLALLATPINPPSGNGGGGSSQGPRFGVGGQPIYPEGGGFADLFPPGSSGAGTTVIDNSQTITIEGSLLDEGAFDDIMNRALLNNIKRGMTQMPAGSLP